METLYDVFQLLDPYGIAALGAALLGFGLVSGLLLVSRGSPGQPFRRPYFMSAFGMAILAFVVAAVERPMLAEDFRGALAVLKGLVILVTGAYGVALVRRAWTRPLANRPLGTYVIVCVTCTLLPGVAGVVGSVWNRLTWNDAEARSVQEVRDRLAEAAASIWTPLMAAGAGATFLVAACLLLLFRKASGR